MRQHRLLHGLGLLSVLAVLALSCGGGGGGSVSSDAPDAAMVALANNVTSISIAPQRRAPLFLFDPVSDTTGITFGFEVRDQAGTALRSLEMGHDVFAVTEDGAGLPFVVKRTEAVYQIHLVSNGKAGSHRLAFTVQGAGLRAVHEATYSVSDLTIPTASSYPVQSAPVDVVLGDLDRDGSVDIACANRDSGSVSVLLNDRKNVFNDTRHLSCGGAPACVSIGDVNGDAVPDLVALTSSGSGGSICVLAGSGGGAFQAPRQTALAFSPSRLLLADVNADGKPDLAALDAAGGAVRIHTGTGGGDFSAGASLATGANPSGLASADFNRDGRPDLVTADAGAGRVSVFLGSGGGAFQAAAGYTVGTKPTSVWAGDLDGDGIPDLATANEDSQDVSVLLGRGDGTFGAPTTIWIGTKVQSIGADSFKGEGVHLSFVLPDERKLAVLKNAGNGTFPHAPCVLALGRKPGVQVIGHIANPTLRTDWVVAEVENGSVSVILGN